MYEYLYICIRMYIDIYMIIISTFLVGLDYGVGGGV